VGPDAHLVGDAVLALHDLGLVNPRRIRVAVPHRDRHELPDYIEVVRETIPEADRTQYEGIPATTVARALLDCRETVMTDRLIAAAHEAARTGLLRRREAARVLAELGASEDVDA
jgi:predicted transcriptional regulator of viral defense system